MSQIGKRTAGPPISLAKRRKEDAGHTKGTFETELELLVSSPDEVQGDDNAKWRRDPIEKESTTEKDIAFQVFDIETYFEQGSVSSFDRTNVKLYGVTRNGNSVCAIITDYFPHFYFQAPENFVPEHLDIAQRSLNNAIANSLRRANSNTHLSSVVTDNLVHLDIVQGENVYYYRGSERKYPFIKVTGTTNSLNKAKNELKSGAFSFGNGGTQVIWIFKFFRHFKLFFGNSFKILCYLLRTLSLDIECMGRRGVFPEPNEDPVIQIANMVKVEGQSEPFIRNCFVLGSCAPVIGSNIIQCDNESQLLQRWAEFIRAVDPDIITGYNILNFDLPYILDRAKFLLLKVLKLPKVAMLGRQKDRASGVRDAAISSKQMGSRVNKSIDIHGRVIFDVLQVTVFLSLYSYDVPFLFRLAIYCMKDAALPLRLLDKLMSVINYMEMARVTGVPLNYLLTRGQQIKILSMMLRKCKSEQFFLPVIDVLGGDSEGYEGATVIEPLRGFYNEPIATLDFASLYPSIMIAHNLCYTTLLKKPDGIEGKDYIKTPTGNLFATKERRRGLLPIILEDLLVARKRAKNDMKHEKDEFRKMVLNGRQLALKILTEGEHTRVRTVVQSKVGGLAAFTKKQATCLGISTLNELENQFSRLWTECQNCAKSYKIIKNVFLHISGNSLKCYIGNLARDCPIYYMREKVRSDLTDAFQVIERFGEPSW
uniref:DNA polymerase delta catalytic subunit n=1 Tax=Heterorhabditis bacteriophora TaxID=37862 RepID=A0A1I7XHW6_HETBA